MFAGALALQPAIAAAQVAQPVQTAPLAQPTVVFQPQVDASQTREQLQDLLRQYPPAVGEVLQRDPSLLAREDYIAPYPALVQFLRLHPEIGRNPTFYFGGYNYWEARRERMPPEIEALGALLGGLAGLLVGMAFFGVLVYLVRAVVNHRRWVRVSRLQAEVHTKLLDRMTSNDELLTYIQSPAGRRYLESAPPPLDGVGPRIAAPIGSIIFAMMAGIVLATVGVGFQVAVQSVVSEAKEAFTVVGVIIFSLGVGFILSSLMAYLVSARLGLLQRPSPAVSTDNA